MNTKNIAAINYYFRIIQKNQFKLEDVPDKYKEEVTKKLEEAAKETPTES